MKPKERCARPRTPAEDDAIDRDADVAILALASLKATVGRRRAARVGKGSRP